VNAHSLVEWAVLIVWRDNNAALVRVSLLFRVHPIFMGVKQNDTVLFRNK
jgi:hypothetical protein